MCHLVVRGVTARIETLIFQICFSREVGSGWDGRGDQKHTVCFAKELRLLGFKQTPGRAKD